MQKIQIFLALALFLGTSLLTSCNHDNSNTPTTTPASGSWKVSYFFSKQDETSNYAGYTFDFGSNGSITATNNGQTWSGTWTTGVDNSKDKFVIAFSGSVPSALTDLQEDWLILKMDNSVMEFDHVSGGNGGTDVLHFEHL